MKLSPSTSFFILLTFALLLVHVEAAGACTSYKSVFHIPRPTGTTTKDAHLAYYTDTKDCAVVVSAASREMPVMILLAAVPAVILL
jgi:hypothetical protein